MGHIIPYCLGSPFNLDEADVLRLLEYGLLICKHAAADDRTYQGKELRLKQQHFFVSATIQV